MDVCGTVSEFVELKEMQTLRTYMYMVSSGPSESYPEPDQWRPIICGSHIPSSYEKHLMLMITSVSSPHYTSRASIRGFASNLQPRWGLPG